MGASPEEFFGELDKDQGGSIDQEEFRGFLKFHEVAFSKKQLLLLWPMLCEDKMMGLEDLKKFLKAGEHSGWSTRLMQDR
jgi:hypothetical protein